MKRTCLIILIVLFALIGVCTTCLVAVSTLTGDPDSPAAEDSSEVELNPSPTPLPAETDTPTSAPPETAPTPSLPPPPTATATALPTLTPTPAPTPTPTVVPSLVTPVVGESLVLTVSDIPQGIPDYNRSEWDYGIDADRDCQYTRHEVLIQESRLPVTFTNPRRCTVATGEWFAIYRGVTVTDPRQLDIDHFVPLSNAHRTGGWEWSAEKKRDYANNLDDRAVLIAVTSGANRSKSDKGPDEWRPPNTGFWCQYAVDWIGIKQRWGLFATPAEARGLQVMLETCPEPIDVTIVEQER